MLELTNKRLIKTYLESVSEFLQADLSVCVAIQLFEDVFQLVASEFIADVT